jgi:ATP-binding protein involved in chromosome partitioning
MGRLGGEKEKKFRRDIARIVKVDCGFSGLQLQLEESKIFGSITQKPIHFIGIISGKGGVGKSSVAANIAYRMSKRGYKVGVIDADVYGSSLPTIFEVEHQNPKFDENKKIIPIEHNGIEMISTEFFTNPGQPVLWRGGMLNSMISHFFYDVKWHDKTEYVIIDFPPGTGDITMDIKNIVPQTKMLLVTTPHPSACHVAVKSGHAATKLGHEIIGIIENMSYYVNPINNQREYIFGQGGGRKIAEQLNTELIAQIPIGQSKSNTDLFEITETQGKIYDEIADFIILNTMDK